MKKENGNKEMSNAEVNASVNADLKRQDVFNESEFETFKKAQHEKMGIDGNQATVSIAIREGQEFGIADIMENQILSDEKDDNGKFIPVQLNFKSMSFKTDKGATIGVKQFAAIVSAPEDLPDVGTTFDENLAFLYYCKKWNVRFRCLNISQPAENNQFGYKPKTFTLMFVSQSDK